MNQKFSAKNALKIIFIFAAIFFVVLFSSAQQTFSSPQYAEDEINLQDDSNIANNDGDMFTAVTPTTYSSASDDAIARSRLVTINEKGRNSLPATPDHATQQIMQLNLFEDVVLTVVQDRIELNESGSYTWFGHVKDVEFSDVILVVNGSLMTGQITMPAATYNITPIEGNLHRIAQINTAAILSGEDDSRIPPLSDDQEAALAPDASDDGSIIDVMVLYTDDAVAAHTAGTLQNWIELFMAYTNQAYINSNINQRAVLVQTAEIAYNEPGDLSTALSDLTTKNDGKLEDAHTWRNTYHADLVLLLVNDDGSPGSCSGLAWVQTNVTPSFETNGFGVMKACSFGAGVFAHELGHTMGGQHDWYVGTETVPYPYAHGYIDITNGFRTIINTGHAGGQEVFAQLCLTITGVPALGYLVLA